VCVSLLSANWFKLLICNVDALESLQTEDALMESKRKLEKAEIEERSKAHLSLVEAKKCV
jgi:hypothetical protein